MDQGYPLTNDTLTWLHLSDLHYCPDKTGWDARRVLKALRDDLDELASEQGLRPDLIFFTGDAAYGELPHHPIRDQFDAAGKFFEEVRELCRVKRENVFLVPGNHDVHRGEVSQPLTEWLDTRARQGQGALEEVQELMREAGKDWQSIMARLGAYRQFLEGIRYDHLLTDPERLIYAERRRIRGIDVAIAGLNSAWSCGRDGEKGDLWLAGEWQVATLEPHIEEAQVVIGLIHHPRGWFVSAEDPSVEPLFERVFDFHLHGHEHHAWVKRSDGHVRIAAGACYDRSDRPNGYNLVRLDFVNEKAEVWQREYERDVRAWQHRFTKGKTDIYGVWHLDRLRCFERRRLVTAPGDEATPTEALDEKDRPSTESLFLDDVFDALARNPIVLLLAQEGRVERETIAAMKARAAAINGEESVLHVTPPPKPAASLDEYFIWLAAQCGFEEIVRNGEEWASILRRRLSGGERLFLLVNGFEKGSAKGRRELSQALRSLADSHGTSLSVVFGGGEQLAALKYEQGSDSMLDAAERLDWPEPEIEDVIVWQRRSFPDLKLQRQDAGELLVRCGGDPRLVRVCLEQRQHGEPGEDAEVLAAAYFDLYGPVFLPYGGKSEAKEEMCEWLEHDDLGPYRPWISDSLLRRLYWRNALARRGRRLEWRCEAVRDVGRKVLACV